MSNPAFIVDGFTEFRIIQKLCPRQPVRRTDLNGRDVTIKAMALKIASIIRLLGNRYYPIVILTDKEERNINFADMSTSLRTELISAGVTDQDLRIGVADRMLESWIIADWFNLTGQNENEPEATDGMHGTSIIKRIKGSYDKVVDGVDLFCSCDLAKIYAKSPSFRHFADQLENINCSYLQFDKQ